MSPLHLFFRDYTGTFFTIALILSLYVAMIFPDSFIARFFQLHGKVILEGKTLYAKSIHDIQTVITFATLLLTLRYFLSNTLFRLLAKTMGIRNSPSQPQIEHKCEVGSPPASHPRSKRGWCSTTSSPSPQGSLSSDATSDSP